MSSQIMTIGPAPCEVHPAQVGAPDYDERSRIECQVFKRMLARLYPVPANCPATLIIKSSAHDFGAYREVCVRYDDANQQANDYAYAMEANTPVQWDAIASYELAWLERQAAFNRAVHGGEIRQEEIPAIFRSGLPDLPAGQTIGQLLAAFPF
ncbi:MAG: hypothetical protein FWG56_06195 [Desulfovibrionaceae bacterium]|nr:hypothetical protein [Desulfovibrionaceae bacterium]